MTLLAILGLGEMAMDLKEIIRAAEELYNTAHRVNTLGKAQDAVATVAKLIYSLAKELENDRHSGEGKPVA